MPRAGHLRAGRAGISGRVGVSGRPGTALAASSPFLTSLIAYYKLDEASGTRADSSGNALTLTDNNTVTQAVGKIAGAGQFTALNTEFLSRADEALLRTGDIDFTVCGWFYFDSLPVATEVLSKWGGSTNEYTLEILTTGAVNFYVNSVATSAAAAGGTVTTATWYFIVAWYDATANTINLQINDGVATTGALSGGCTVGTSAFNIGALAGTFTMDGRIDEVGFWKRVLTAGERTALYNGGSGVTYPAFA